MEEQIKQIKQAMREAGLHVRFTKNYGKYNALAWIESPKNAPERFVFDLPPYTTISLIDKNTTKKLLLLNIDLSKTLWRPYRMISLGIPNPKKLPLLVGLDEKHLFMVRIDDPVQSIDQAIALLKPRCVQRALNKGLEVKRQGEWFFIPSKLPEDAKIFRKLHLKGAHIADEGVLYNKGKIKRIYVKGNISHKQHNTLYLPTWHRAVLNQPDLYRRITKIYLGTRKSLPRGRPPIYRYID